MGTKKSNFAGSQTIPDGAYMDFFINGQNYKMDVETLYKAVESYVNPINVIVETVTTPYTVSDDDTGKFLVFDEVGAGTINIPDNLSVGVNFAFANVGTGTVTLNLTGTDTLRGSPTVSDTNGYGAATKITLNTWQSSEL